MAAEEIPFKITKLTHYKFEQLLGAGSYGFVAKFSKDGQFYAVKFIYYSPSKVSAEKEVLMLKYLNDFDFPIPKIYHWGLIPGFKLTDIITVESSPVNVLGTYTFIIMDWIPGKNLEEFLKENYPIDPASIYNISVWLMDILQRLHENSIVHRDIKLENIIITAERKLYLVDLGFSCLLDKSPVSCPNERYGTYIYMSPELIIDEHASSRLFPKADVWAAGVCMYRLATNKFPWNASDAEVRVLKRSAFSIFKDRLLNVPMETPMVPFPIDTAINLALIKNYDDRPSAYLIHKFLSENSFSGSI